MKANPKPWLYGPDWQSPRAFGHINTQAYGKTKVQSEEEL